MFHRQIIASLVVSSAACSAAVAQEVLTNPTTGQTHQITGRQLVTRSVPETRIVENKYTVSTPRTVTEYQPSSRTVYTPVTEYQWEPYMANRWNPFTSPSVQYRYVPRTRWELRTEQVHIPVTRQEFVNEERISRVPVTTYRNVTEEHVTAVAVKSDPFANNGTAVALKPQTGSTGQITNEIPARPSTSTAWRN
jgi:hypothetical protein